jgi:diketogulonate reductase-like aldo/keto reductase
VDHLKLLAKHKLPTPQVNQIELHPYLTQNEVRDYCKQQNIQLEAYSPLGSGVPDRSSVPKLIEDPKVLQHQSRIVNFYRYRKSQNCTVNLMHRSC